MVDSYILAIDQGTTSSRSVLVDSQSNLIAVAQKEFQQLYPQPGWVEHDPMEIWSSQSATMTEVLARANITEEQVHAIGITNQRETVIVWNRDTGKPIYNAIVWQDRRTADFCSKLKADGLEPLVTEKTGLRLDPYFSGTKVRWILENVSGARKMANENKLCFGTVDSWLVWKLTQGKKHLTDATNASRTLFFNLQTGDWDDELLEIFEVPRSMLPEIRSSSEIYAEVGDHHQLEGRPIAGIAGDQHAALFGQTCFSPGMAKNTYGTGCFLLMNTGDQPIRSQNNLLTTLAWKVGNKTEYALEGSIFVAGAVVQWLRDELELVRSNEELDELAASVEDSNGVFLVPAFTGLGAPHWDPYARGSMFGLTRGANRAHLCRAALESIAFQTAELIKAMEKDSGLRLEQLKVDGGACRSQPLMQFQADLLQTEVVRPTCVESTAIGAAYLAGLATGYWPNREAIVENQTIDSIFYPQRTADSMRPLLANWHNAVERSKRWVKGN